MRYKLVLSIFAESDTTGRSVELCPGGLVEEHPSVDSMVGSLCVACEQGWGTMSRQELSDFYTRLEHEADAAARILEMREQSVAAGPAGEGKKSQWKAKPRKESNAV